MKTIFISNKVYLYKGNRVYTSMCMHACVYISIFVKTHRVSYKMKVTLTFDPTCLHDHHPKYGYIIRMYMYIEIIHHITQYRPFHVD